MDGISTANPDEEMETTTFLDGSTRKVAALPSLFVGRGVYRPGWRWSLHAGGRAGRTAEHHIGYVVSGRFMIEDRAGNRCEAGPGEAFEVGQGHDAWVIGDEPCVALDFEMR